MPKSSRMHVLFVLWYKPLSSIQTSNLPTSPIQGTIHHRHWSIGSFTNTNHCLLTWFHEFSNSVYCKFVKKLYTTPQKVYRQKGRPCGFVQSLGRPIVQSISHFLWLAKGKLSRLRDRTIFFVHSLDFFVRSRYQRVTNFQKRLDKKFKRVNKKNVHSLRSDNFLLADHKKWEIDQTIGRPRDWTKPHGRPYWAETDKELGFFGIEK